MGDKDDEKLETDDNESDRKSRRRRIKAETENAEVEFDGKKVMKDTDDKTALEVNNNEVDRGKIKAETDDEDEQIIKADTDDEEDAQLILVKSRFLREPSFDPDLDFTQLIRPKKICKGNKEYFAACYRTKHTMRLLRKRPNKQDDTNAPRTALQAWGLCRLYGLDI